MHRSVAGYARWRLPAKACVGQIKQNRRLLSLTLLVDGALRQSKLMCAIGLATSALRLALLTGWRQGLAA
jgi:hypothetical protein